MLANTPQANTDDSGEDPASKRVIGKSGRSIVFSWTWNENRKKDIDDVKSANGSKGSVDDVVSAATLSKAIERVFQLA